MKRKSDRDFIGYGEHPPQVVWPKHARLALSIVVNYEAGGERSVIYGDSGPETYGEFASYGTPPRRDLAIESIFEYEPRVAIWRILELLDKHATKVTFYATASTLQVNPKAAKEIVKRGHEICGHGFRWIEHYTLSKKQEREAIRNSIEIQTRLTGTRPLGWYCREPSENTIDLLMEDGGFLYDSDVYNDDLPYFEKRGNKNLLLIPYASDTNDFHFFSNRFTTANDFFTYLKDSFDVLYEEGNISPKMMSVGVHTRISGKPGRIRGLERFLDYAMRKRGVWVARRVDIAKWWIKNHDSWK